MKIVHRRTAPLRQACQQRHTVSETTTNMPNVTETTEETSTLVSKNEETKEKTEEPKTVHEIVSKNTIEEVKTLILQELRKPPQTPNDLVTLKHAQEMIERIYLKVAKEQREAISQRTLNAPIQYIFLNQSSQQKAEKQADGSFQFNLAETFMWPTKATIVSAHVMHSLAGTSSLRMYSFQSQNSRVDIATSETVPYVTRGLKVEVAPDTKVWFSVVTANQIPTVTVVLGLIFQPIDLLSLS
jgi:hypothetical protein